MVGRNAAVRVAITADNSSLTKGLKDSESKLGRFGKTVGKVTAGAAAVAAVGLGALAKASISAASDAQQSLGATETVFGKAANKIIAKSKEAATVVGLSANQYRSAANLMGGSFLNAGVPLEKTVGWSERLITRAADMNAAFGQLGDTTQTVTDAMASAFRGEFDPLERFNVQLTAAKITTAANALAQQRYGKELKALPQKQQDVIKRQATYNAIMAQSSRVAGQFSGESNTLAGQQQRLAAQFTNLKSKLGAALLPAITNVFKALNTDLMPALNKLADKHLPKVQRALDEWTRDLDVTRMIRDLGRALRGVDWRVVSKGASDVGAGFADMRESLKGTSTSDVNDGLKVLGVTVGFLADHLTLLGRALPYIAAGFVALKTAQLANRIAGRDSLIGLAAQLIATRRLTLANRELAVAVRGVSAAQGVLVPNTAGAVAGLSKMKFAAAGVAGAAGLGLVAASTQVTNTKISGLMSVLGSAGMGAAAGAAFGPWGIAIGGAAGALTGLIGSIGKSKDAMKKAAPVVADYASSFDRVTGAVTEATRATAYNALAESGALATLEKAGISRRTVVDAVTGERGAMLRLTGVLAAQRAEYDANMTKIDDWKDRRAAAMKSLTQGTGTWDQEEKRRQENVVTRADQEIAALTATTNAQKTAIDTTKTQTDEIVRQGREAKRRAIAVTDYATLLKGLPAKAITRIETTGLPSTIRGIARLATRYNLTPKQVRTVIDATGVDVTVRKVKTVQDRLKEAGKTRPDFTVFRQATNKFMDDLGVEARRGGEGVGKAAKEGVKKGAKADLSGFRSSVRNGVNNAKATASSGGFGVGESLKSGTLAGVGGLGAELSQSMSGAVNQAIAAGRAAADAHSPSRKTEKLGRDLAAGLVVGVTKGSDGVTTALEKLSDRTTKILERQLNRREALIRKRLKGKAETAALKELQAAWKAHARAVDAAGNVLEKRLRKNGKAQDALQSGNFLPYLKSTSKLFQDMRAAGVKNLDEARDRLQQLRDDSKAYAENIAGVFAAFGDITQLGRNEDTGGVSFALLLDQLRDRARDAERLNTLLTEFAGLGLDQSLIDQIIAAGPETGLATAEAIESALKTQGI